MTIAKYGEDVCGGGGGGKWLLFKGHQIGRCAAHSAHQFDGPHDIFFEENSFRDFGPLLAPQNTIRRQRRQKSLFAMRGTEEVRDRRFAISPPSQPPPPPPDQTKSVTIISMAAPPPHPPPPRRATSAALSPTLPSGRPDCLGLWGPSRRHRRPPGGLGRALDPPARPQSRDPSAQGTEAQRPTHPPQSTTHPGLTTTLNAMGWGGGSPRVLWPRVVRRAIPFRVPQWLGPKHTNGRAVHVGWAPSGGGGGAPPLRGRPAYAQPLSP